MKKNIFISMAVAGIMVFNMGLSVFAEEPVNNDETAVNTEIDTVLNDSEDVSAETGTETKTETETETETEPVDNADNNDDAISDTDVTVDTIDGNSNTSIEDNVNGENSNDEETANEDSAESNENVEENTDDKTEPEQDKEAQQQEKIDEKEKKIEAANRFREIKLLAKATKIEGLTYLKELRTLFKDVDKADRQEVLSELASIKNELKDYSIDAFVNGVFIDFEKYDNVKPVIENEHTLAPVRAVTEALGADVQWNEETH